MMLTQKENKPVNFALMPIRKHPYFKGLILTAIIMTIYGSLFLMVGYTQILVAKTLFNNSTSDTKYMPLMLVPQMIGLYIGSIIYGYFIKKFNLRWVYMGFLSLAAIGLIIIAFLDKYGSNEISLIFIYIIFSFLFGVGIGPVNPLISMYIGDIFTGERRVRLLGIINAFYGLGAGLFPLVFSSFILKYSGGNGDSYEGARIFYLIAFGLAILGILVSFFVKYKFSVDKQTVKSNKSEQKQLIANDNDYKKPFWFCFLLMTMLFVIATALIFNFTQFITAAGGKNPADSWKIIAIQAFGVYALVQGAWRTFSGLWVSKKMSSITFLYLSLFITLIAVVIIFADGLKYEAGVFIVAALLGLGLGNVYPVLFNYALELNMNHKIYLSRQMGIAQGLGVVLGQISVGAFWVLHQATNATKLDQDAVLIFNVLFIVLTIIALFFTARSVHKFRHTNKQCEENSFFHSKKIKFWKRFNS